MADYESGYDPKYGYNKNAFAHGTIGTTIAGTIVKAISAPIGITSEALQDYRDRKRSRVEAAQSSEETRVTLAVGHAQHPIDGAQALTVHDNNLAHEPVVEQREDIYADEADWALDDVVSESEAASEETSEIPFAAIQTISTSPTSAGHKLPFPVVLPQRRPGTKARGFVRAYAPVLADKGIDQERFLSFLRDFHRAAQASPIFDVIMVATALAGAYPDPIVGAAVQAVQVIAGLGREMQERWRANKFLAQANKEMFMPKGLFAMVVTYKPTLGDDPEVSVQTIDWSVTAVAKYGKTILQDNQQMQDQTTMDKAKQAMSNLRIASAKSVGESEMPASCASLIFPTLESAAAAMPEAERKRSTAAEALKSTSKSTSKWLNDYYDRRAQASYGFHNPDTMLSQMAPEAPKFKSRFADPNDAVNTHLFTLLSGGRFKAEPLGAKRRWKKAQRDAAEKRAQGLKVTPTKRLLQEDVLYLMVVNMPTEEELEKARQQIAGAAARRQGTKEKQSDM